MIEIYLVQSYFGDILFCTTDYDDAKKMWRFYTFETSVSAFIKVLDCHPKCPVWVDDALSDL